MHQRRRLLHRSRCTKYTYRHHFTLFTSSNDMASSDKFYAKDSFIYHILDWNLVGPTLTLEVPS